ncbi:hypothetical protein D9M70_421200 [compost metagenome]
MAVQAHGARIGLVVHALQRLGDDALRLAVDGAVDRQVEPVHVVAAFHAGQAGDIGAHAVDGLARDERLLRPALRRRGLVQRLRQRGVAQLGGDDAVGGQQAQVAGRQRIQVGVVAAQMVRRPALRNDQRQRTLEYLRLARLRRALVHFLEQPVDLAEILAVPDPQRIADPVDLAEALARRQRHGVEVVDHDALARALRVGAVQVGSQRRRRHLPEFLGNRRGASLGRMPVLLDLRGQRAAARRVVRTVGQPDELVEHRARQPAPVQRRVHVGIFGVEQALVLDIQQRAHQQRRHRGEIGILALRIALERQRQPIAVAQQQAGLVLLAVRREQALVHQPDHVGRHARLFGGNVTTLLQAPRELRQHAVAHAGIIRTGMREADAVAGAGLDLEGQPLAEFADQPRLPVRIAHFARDKAIHDIDAPGKGDRQASENPATTRHVWASLFGRRCAQRNPRTGSKRNVLAARALRVPPVLILVGVWPACIKHARGHRAIDRAVHRAVVNARHSETRLRHMPACRAPSACVAVMPAARVPPACPRTGSPGRCSRGSTHAPARPAHRSSILRRA